ncbi:MAG: thioether cross-link-forming SCIFF peptide maturase [Clostridiales Family XIII bacterium]|jgi:uncharacterized protein|nr:thioether cross-link-forming SCIFF peptide maturase [Clostridiales Family XIII bacterium]
MIHCYKFKEHNIVLDINSGAVHIVSDVVYDILSPLGDRPDTDGICAMLLSGRHNAAKGKAVSEINKIIKSGMLFSCDDQVSHEMLEDRDAVIKALCLHIAHDCNMSCAYCFAGEGSFSGEKSLLSVETGRKAIDFLLKQSGQRRNLEIDFFGGEPLMNFEVIKALVAYGREREKLYGKHIRFTITTNGLLLDPMKELFINENMDNVILSIDGRPQINDAMRKTRSGGGTYNLVIDNYTRLAKSRDKMFYVRGTFTNRNLDFSEDVKHLAALGFSKVSVEPVVSGESSDYSIREEDLPRILEEYDKLADLCIEYAEKGEQFAFFHFNIDLSNGPCVVKRVSGCGAGTEYAAISAEGDIYPCHQFVGEPEFKLGNLYDFATDADDAADSGFNNLLYEFFNRAHIYNKEECKACWAKFYCSGGCHANALHINGDILEPYAIGCVLERKRVECAIGIQCHLAAD